MVLAAFHSEDGSNVAKALRRRAAKGERIEG
jgi:hypothetical protein